MKQRVFEKKWDD